jgi:hypothetical protein
MSVREIAAEHKRPHSTISRFLKKSGVQVKSSKEVSRKYFFNENYFENIDCHKKAYWLGWLMADGYVEHDFKSTTIRLQERDSCILKEFKKDLDYTGEVKRIKSKLNNKTYPLVCLRLYSTKMARDLAKYNVIPAKGKCKLPPTNIPEEFIPSFILGEFEGDGSCPSQKDGARLRTEMSIWDTFEVCSFIKSFIDKCYKKNIGKVAKRTGQNIYVYRISRWQNLKLFYDLIYNIKDFNFCLERKRQKFIDYFNKRNEIKSKQTSAFRGVCFCKNIGKFSASYTHKRKKTVIGYFLLENEAAKAYDKAAKEIWGEKASLNFPNE